MMTVCMMTVCCWCWMKASCQREFTHWPSLAMGAEPIFDHSNTAMTPSMAAEALSTAQPNSPVAFASEANGHSAMADSEADGHQDINGPSPALATGTEV